MNFLAHIYLSGDDPNVIIGNFIADGIKGKNYQKFPLEIQYGILLHREIDTFTDAHPIVRQSTKRLHKNFGHYSGVLIDVFYDHFLAKNWKHYHKLSLAVFVDNFYQLLKDNYTILPKRIQNMMPYMIADNWLVSYAQVSGIERILTQMNRRVSSKTELQLSIVELQAYYTLFEEEFTLFFTLLQNFCDTKLKEIKKGI